MRTVSIFHYLLIGVSHLFTVSIFHFSLSNWCQSPISKKEKEWFMLKKIPYELSDFKRIRIYTGDGRFEK